VEAVIDYYPRLRRLRDYVVHNLHEEISLEDAARQAGMERTYFSTYFHKTTGFCFHSWLRLIRINRALEILRSNDCSITELAFNVGYNDLTTFERAFKRTMGCTPSFLRNIWAPKSSQFSPKAHQKPPRRPSSLLCTLRPGSEPGTTRSASASEKGESMAPPRKVKENTLQVRGSVDVEKFRAAKALGGGDVTFELRAMKPVKAAQAQVSCIVCLVCFVCIVCVASNAERFGITDLPALEG